MSHHPPQGAQHQGPDEEPLIYSLLKGTIVDALIWPPTSASPHYHLLVKTSVAAVDTYYDVAINIASTVPGPGGNESVLYQIRGAAQPGFAPAEAKALIDASQGMYDKGNFPDGITGIDYTRDLDGNGDPLLDPKLLNQNRLPIYRPHLAGSGQDALTILVQSNMAADAFLFGHRYGNPAKPGIWDEHGVEIPDGIHNIHMNQGNTGGHGDENGQRDDGTLLLHIADQGGGPGRWYGVYIAFQTQTWDNNVDGTSKSGAEELGNF